MVALLVDYLSVVDSPGRAFDSIWKMTKEAGIDIEEPLMTVRNHAAALTALSPKAEVLFDASFSPRLDYYTGVVFEMQAAAGAVLVSGGQYDRLLQRLGAAQPVTAAGCAVWIDRLEEELLA
jgi:ATP phosphoribosyltransferase regulatory subunit